MCISSIHLLSSVEDATVFTCGGNWSFSNLVSFIYYDKETIALHLLSLHVNLAVYKFVGSSSPALTTFYWVVAPTYPVMGFMA